MNCALGHWRELADDRRGDNVDRPGETTANDEQRDFPDRIVQVGQHQHDNAGFDVLLGMDIIRAGSLKIEGNGTFSFSI
jgi:hypothetical protein